MVANNTRIAAYKEQFEQYLSEKGFEGFPTNLEASAGQIMKIKGKRIRPLLLMLSCEMFGGDIRHTLGPAAAIEIYHNFSLVHDDIIDKADLRRGNPTVHKVFGVDKAILTGDAMLIQGYKLLSHGPKDKFYEMSRVFTQAALRVIEGEQDDVDFEERHDVSEAEYLRMIEYKTSVLIAAGMQIGAIIGNANEIEQQSVYDFGVNLGLAFQIMDDYLDTYGDKNFGKKIGGDILQNKNTYLLVHALEKADESTRNEIIRLFTEQNENAKLSRMMAIFDQLDVKKVAFEKMQFYYQKALDSLDNLSIEPGKLEQLKAFARSVYERKF